MVAEENKKLMEQIFAGLANGDSRLLVESMADDFRWTVSGSTKWSKTYEGKQAVLSELFGALRPRIAGRMRTTGFRFIAENDYVVVEARGNDLTTEGKPYNNSYCFVFRLAAGKLKEVTEYMDTALVEAVLDDRVTTPHGRA
jgi:uncharacterized protein